VVEDTNPKPFPLRTGSLDGETKLSKISSSPLTSLTVVVCPTGLVSAANESDPFKKPLGPETMMLPAVATPPVSVNVPVAVTPSVMSVKVKSKLWARAAGAAIRRTSKAGPENARNLCVFMILTAD